MRIIRCVICGLTIKTKSNRRKYCGDKKSKKSCAGLAWSLSKRWNGIMRRCYDVNSRAYKWYGGRGITVCDRWHDRENFIKDLKNSYDPNLSIDRINNDEGYNQNNIRWATQRQQVRNQTQNIYLTANGKTQIQADWARELNIKKSIISSRKKAGWSDEEALGFIDRETPRSPTMKEVSSISDIYYLGGLCHRGHEYKKTGGSKRYKSCHKCWQCARVELKKRRSRESKKASL